MARIILFGIAAVVALVLLFVLFWNLLHLLILGFWVLLVVLLHFRLSVSAAGPPRGARISVWPAAATGRPNPTAADHRIGVSSPIRRD